MDLQDLFTSFDGRINRAKWWGGGVILVIIFFVLAMFIDVVFGTGFFGGFLETLVVLALFYPSYALCAKRFQDRNKPGTSALFGLVPLVIAILLAAWGLTGVHELNGLGWLCVLVILGVGLWFLIDLVILRVTPGQNTYGGDPLTAIS
jgi:uncharacterized membrane protein YhaH (DUF805 family)